MFFPLVSSTREVIFESNLSSFIPYNFFLRERETDRQTDRQEQTDREGEREKDGDKERERDRQIDRQTGTDRQRGRERERERRRQRERERQRYLLLFLLKPIAVIFSGIWVRMVYTT